MKRRITGMLCLLLALALLCGCADPAKEAEERIAQLEKDYSVAAATYEGGEVTIGEAMSDFNYLYSMYYSYVSSYGLGVETGDVASLMGSAIETRVGMEVAAARFDAQHSLSGEELDALKADAQNQYDAAYAQALAQAEGKSDAEKAANARLMLFEIGMDPDSVYQNVLLGEKTVRMEDMLAAEITEISEEALLAAYEAEVLAYEEAFEGGTAYFELDMANPDTLVCWYPEGYRAVKHVLLTPDEAPLADFELAGVALAEGEEALAALEAELALAQDDDSEEGPKRSVEELQALIADAEARIGLLEADLAAKRQVCLDEVQADIDAVYARYAAGEDFDALIAQYGQDEGMKVSPTMERGYMVSAASTVWDNSFRDAAMSIAAPGQLIEAPVVSAGGVHIILYAGEILPGPVPLEQVRQPLYEKALAEAGRSHAVETIDAWVAETNPRYDLDAFASALVKEG